MRYFEYQSDVFKMCQFATAQLEELHRRLFVQLQHLLDENAANPDKPLTVLEFARFMYDLEADVFDTMANQHGAAAALSLPSLKASKIIRF